MPCFRQSATARALLSGREVIRELRVTQGVQSIGGGRSGGQIQWFQGRSGKTVGTGVGQV